jgi:hypothetical protein
MVGTGTKTILVVGGLAAVGVTAYLILTSKGTSAGGGILGTGGQTTSANNGPTSQSEPSPYSPSAPFRSTPSLATGSSNGSFVLQETYSPYWSQQNDYSSHTQNDFKTQTQTTVKLF